MFGYRLFLMCSAFAVATDYKYNIFQEHTTAVIGITHTGTHHVLRIYLIYYMLLSLCFVYILCNYPSCARASIVYRDFRCSVIKYINDADCRQLLQVSHSHHRRLHFVFIHINVHYALLIYLSVPVLVPCVSMSKRKCM